MSPRNFSVHYVGLKNAYEEYNMTHEAKAFNIDKAGLTTREAGRGRANVCMCKHDRSNILEVNSESNAEHVTLMPVLSADGKAWNPIAILPGVQTKWWTRADGVKKRLPLIFRRTAVLVIELQQEWTQICF